MKAIKKKSRMYAFLILSVTLFAVSCKKENSAVTTSSSTLTQATVAALQAVAVGRDSVSNDSVYVIGACANHHHLDSISFSGLPATITDYLTANYTGYTFLKAFTDKDTSGNITGYVVIIQFNGNPVGVKFDASGNFIKVLEQREGHDLSGNGWHQGGRFNDRDRLHRDTIAPASLPQTILSYFATYYPQDTLVSAYKNRDSSVVVFSTDNGAFVTVFNANGSFVKRIELDPHTGNAPAGHIAAVDQDSLPVVVLAYLTTTYPDYVFKAAFSWSGNGTLQGYIVCIDANGTKYAIAFDASGTFIKAITIR